MLTLFIVHIMNYSFVETELCIFFSDFFTSISNTVKNTFAKSAVQASPANIQILANPNNFNLCNIFTSTLFEAKMNPKRISEIVGHKDVSTTINIYTHIIKGLEDEEELKICV